MIDGEVRKFIQEDLLRRSESFLAPLLEATETPRSLVIFLGHLGYNTDLLIDSATDELTTTFSAAFDWFVLTLPELQQKIYNAVDSAQDDQIDSYSSLGSFVAECLFNDLRTLVESLGQAIGSSMVPSHPVDEAATVSVSVAKDILSHLSYVYLRREEPLALHFALFIGILDLEFIPALVLGQEPNSIEVRRSGHRYQISIKLLMTLAGSVAELFSTEGLDVSSAYHFIQSLARKLAMRTVRFVEGVASADIQDLSIRLDHNGIQARTSHLPNPPQLIEIPFPLILPVEGIELMPSVIIQPADNGATDQRPTWKLSWNSFELPLPEAIEFGGFQLIALTNPSNSDESSGLFIASDGAGLSIQLKAGVRISVPSDLITDLNGNQLVFDLWAEILASPSGAIPHRSISLEFRLRPFAIADASMGLSLLPPGLGGIRFVLYDPGDVYISAGSGLNFGKEFAFNLSMKRFGVTLPNSMFKPVIRQFHVSEKALKSMRRMALEDSQINRLEELAGLRFNSEAQCISALSVGTTFTDVQLETVLAHTTEWVSEMGGEATGPREILIDAPVKFSVDDSGNTSIDFDGNVTVGKLDPVELAATGFVVEADKISFNLAASKRCLSFEQGILYLPPNLPLVPNLIVQNFAIDPDGISCKVKKSFVVSLSGGNIDPESDMVTSFLDGEIQIALSDLDIELARNSVQLFDIAGMVRLPLLPLVLGVRLGMQQWAGAYQQTLQLESLETASFDLGHGSLSFDQIKFQGKLDQNSFTLNGNITNVVMDLGSPFVLSLETAVVSLYHDSKSERLEMQLGTLAIGPLGTVENARFVCQHTKDGPMTVFIETTLTWQDLRQRLNLDQLPDHFPLPPDNAQVTVYLNWEDNPAVGYKLVLRFAVELSDLGSVWSFVPEAFQPEIRDIRFMFEVTYANAAEFQNASTSDTFTGEVSVEMELRPPALPDIPGTDLFEFDREQWIKASLKGGVRSINGVDEGYMEMGIANAPQLGVNFPGLPQAEPPIQIELTKLDFNLRAQQGSDALTGRLSLEGGFGFRPINPAQSKLPLPPAMMIHMEKLFKAVGLENEFRGTAKLDLKFKGNKASLDLGIAFEQAQIELDLFDMMAGLSRGLASPQGIDGLANSIDLDIDVDIKLRDIKLQFGSIEETVGKDQSQFGFELGLDATIAGVQVDNFSLQLSNKEFSFGFSELAVPVALPRFPVERKHLDELREISGAWGENKWRQEVRPLLVNTIGELKDELDALKIQIEATSGNDNPSLNRDLRTRRQELFENTARQFLIDSIFVLHRMVSEPNRGVYQGMIEAYTTLMDATIHQLAFDTKLDFVLNDVRFVLPFHNPSDIRMEGGAHLRGFKDDDPLKPLEDLKFKVGLSAEYIYFNVEGGDPIPLPVFGEYENEAGDVETKVSLRLNHARIGYGYSKNALVVAFAGELKIAKPLADDLNTAGSIGIGIRLPERSRLGFKLDLIPISLGEVNFLLPLLEFDIDLRKEYSPGISDSATCEPYWDGLQLVVPNIIRQDFKRLRFSPFFGSLLAPNYNLSFDLMLGNAHNGLTYVCDDYLVILPTSPTTIIPMLADGVPFFNNLCTNVRLAGFSVNFNLQRPFPSMSPLALFEIFGLLADPMMPVDPNGALANTIRASIQHARITLPPAVVRMFPEYGPTLSREINYTINLGTLITVMQSIAGPVGQVVQSLQQTTGDITDLLEDIKNNPPQVTPAEVLALLPPELRRIELEGAFVGFEASATFVLLTPDEASEAFKRRDEPTLAVLTTAPKYGEYPDAAWLTTYQPNFSSLTAPLYNPNDPDNSLLRQAPFQEFDEASLAALPTPNTGASGVLVGAEVKVLENQFFRFLGYLFDDGSFGLISVMNIEPLRLSVAGIQFELPLEVNGRLLLTGRAQGAKSYALVTTEVWGAWKPVPGIIELYAGSKDKPIKLMLHSNGRFALKGSGGLKLFGGAATIDGTVDVSHTHCFVEGTFSYKPNAKIGNNHIVELGLTSAGRVGPGNSFELSGEGNLKILGKTVTKAKGVISDNGIAVEAQFDTTDWNWNNISINKFTMALRGIVDLSQPGPPNFLFEGNTYLRIFGDSNSPNRLEITGRGGVEAKAGELATFVEGMLLWQGRQWLQGRMLLHSKIGIQLEGQTHFGLTLSPGNVGGINVASLFFRINLGGTVNISPTGSFSCNLRLDWDLGINLPGNENQTLPIASNSISLTGTLNSPVELINLNGFKLLPLQGFEISLPIPQIKGKGNPIVRIGSKNGKVAINIPQEGTIYIDEIEFVTGLTGGSLPSLSGGTLPSLTPGTLPSLNSGTLPSLTPGTLPNLNKGTLPKLSINFLGPSFNFSTGTLPSLTPGTLPSLTPGKLPSLNPGTLPNLNTGSFPKLSEGSFPKPTKSTVPVPSYSSGEPFEFDRNSKPSEIYKDYEINWQNEVISIKLSTLSSSQISFGIEKDTHRFYLQIGTRKYAFNGEQI